MSASSVSVAQAKLLIGSGLSFASAVTLTDTSVALADVQALSVLSNVAYATGARLSDSTISMANAKTLLAYAGGADAGLLGGTTKISDSVVTSADAINLLSTAGVSSSIFNIATRISDSTINSSGALTLAGKVNLSSASVTGTANLTAAEAVTLASAVKSFGAGITVTGAISVAQANSLVGKLSLTGATLENPDFSAITVNASDALNLLGKVGMDTGHVTLANPTGTLSLGLSDTLSLIASVKLPATGSVVITGSPTIAQAENLVSLSKLASTDHLSHVSFVSATGGVASLNTAATGGISTINANDFNILTAANLKFASADSVTLRIDPNSATAPTGVNELTWALSGGKLSTVAAAGIDTLNIAGSASTISLGNALSLASSGLNFTGAALSTSFNNTEVLDSLPQAHDDYITLTGANIAVSNVVLADQISLLQAITYADASTLDGSNHVATGKYLLAATLNGKITITGNVSGSNAITQTEVDHLVAQASNQIQFANTVVLNATTSNLTDSSWLNGTWTNDHLLGIQKVAIGSAVTLTATQADTLIAKGLAFASTESLTVGGIANTVSTDVLNSYVSLGAKTLSFSGNLGLSAAELVASDGFTVTGDNVTVDASAGLTQDQYASLNNAGFTVTGASFTGSLTNVSGASALLFAASRGAGETVTLASGQTITVDETTYENYLANSGPLTKITNLSSAQIIVTGVHASNIAGIMAASNIKSIAVVDSASNLSTALASAAPGADPLSLNIAKISSITGDGTALTLTAAELANSTVATVLAKVAGSLTYNVTGVTASNAASLASTNSKVIGITVSDTANNIATNFNSLQSISGSKLTAIAVSDSAQVNLSYSQWNADPKPLAALHTAGANIGVTGVSVANLTAVSADSSVKAITLADTVSNIQSGLATVLAHDEHISAVSLSGGSSLTLSQSDWSANSSLFNQFVAANPSFKFNLTGVSISDAINTYHATLSNSIGTVSISDSAANIRSLIGSPSQLLAIQNLGAGVSGITMTGTPDADASSITISASSLASYGDVLSLIGGGSITYDVTGVTATGALTLVGNAAIATVEISDNAANIASKFDSLQSALSARSGSAPTISFALTVSDSTPVALTAAQLTSDSALISKLADTGITYSVSGLTVAGATGSLPAHIAQMSISDTAARITASATALNSLGSKLASITISDSNPIALTQAQYQGSLPN